MTVDGYLYVFVFILYSVILTFICICFICISVLSFSIEILLCSYHSSYEHYLFRCVLLSGVPDYFDRNKILSGYDLSHYQVPHCIRVFFDFV